MPTDASPLQRNMRNWRRPVFCKPIWLSSRFLCLSLQSPVGTPLHPLLQQNHFVIPMGNFDLDDTLCRADFPKRVNVRSPAKRDGNSDGTALVLGAIVTYSEGRLI